MPIVTKAVEVVRTDAGLCINEFFGGAATPSTSEISAALEVVQLPAPKKTVVNPWQTNAFDEYVLVLEGTVRIFFGKDVVGVAEVAPGQGALLPKDTPLQWVFAEDCKFVTICDPAFRPDRVTVHTAAGGEEPTMPTTTTATAAAAAVIQPVAVVQASDVTITEFFGNVASSTPHLSACVAKVTAPCVEAFQCPDFDEYVLVLEGQVNIRKQGEDGAETLTEAKAGEALFLARGERVRWEWPEPCVYVPICTPAFSPQNCRREEEAGAAKDAECMAKLHSLHDEKQLTEPVAGA